MTLPKNAFRINVGFLYNQSIGTSRDIHFDYPEVLLKPDFHLSTFSGVARIGRTSQGIFVQGEFQGETPAQCVRCLAEFSQTLHASFEELYAFDKRSVTESELILPEDANINLEPIIREYLLIEVPISPICRSDCKGLCPICGANLNEESNGHQHPEA